MTEGSASSERPHMAAEAAESSEPLMRVDKVELAELGDEVRALRYDALDSERVQSRSGPDRAQNKGFSGVSKRMRKGDGAYEFALVARNDTGEVEGFIAVDTEGGVATVRQLWLAANGEAEERRAKTIIANLVDAAHRELPERYGSNMRIAAKAPSAQLQSVCSVERRTRWLALDEDTETRESDDSSGHDLEQAA